MEDWATVQCEATVHLSCIYTGDVPRWIHLS